MSSSVGQRVIVLPSTSAGLVEYLAEPPSRVIPIPDNGDLSTWVMCQHMGTVMYSCDRLGGVLGKRVVIMGQGPIGLNFTYWMAQQGARQIITVDLLDYRLRSPSNWAPPTRSIRPGKMSSVQWLKSPAGVRPT